MKNAVPLRENNSEKLNRNYKGAIGPQPRF